MFAITVPTPFLHSYPTRRSSDLVLAPGKILLRLPGFLGAWRAVESRQVQLFYNLPVGCPGHDQLGDAAVGRSEEHTSELQSRGHLVCRLLLEKKKEGRIDRPAAE